MILQDSDYPILQDSYSTIIIQDFRQPPMPRTILNLMVKY